MGKIIYMIYFQMSSFTVLIRMPSTVPIKGEGRKGEGQREGDEGQSGIQGIFADD